MNKMSLLKLATIIPVVCIIIALLCSCDSPQYVEYYSQKENYINVNGTVSSLKYNEDRSVLYVNFSELSPILDDTCFKIVGKNLKTAQANGIDKLEIGEQIAFITAPKYFGDGYVMPIVAVSVNGDDLLKFEEGYENLIDWLSE